MSLQSTTEVLILSTVVIWIAWDIYAYKRGGNLPTESWAFKKWSYYIPGLACLFGILMGHFFFGYPSPEQLCPSGVKSLPIASPSFTPSEIHIGVPKPQSTVPPKGVQK